MQGVERLSIVSKVLFDSRLLELRRENETLRLEQERTIEAVKLEQKSRIDALKLKVFWLQHDDLKLKEHLEMANNLYDGPNCCCVGCYWNGRFGLNPDKRVLPGVNCTFMPWFENEIVDFGMTSSVGHYTEVTTHFATNAWGDCDLGRWILQIPTCEHPELRKVYELLSYFRELAQINDRTVWESYWA
ncbi:MAG: hypothetical protein JZU67_04105 [Burkholderiaceae bacterium]|nr:hypothetical protein [Burkholderiaceae bacterium]